VLQKLQALTTASCQLAPVSTQGDRDTAHSVADIGGKGVFVKEIQAAVLRGEADIAVHSAKDLSSQTPSQLSLAAALERASPADALVGCKWEDLPTGATVATGAPRRQALLRQHRPDLNLVGLRGNIATRLKALERCDAVVIAAAALERIGHTCALPEVVEVLDPTWFIPQAGQGIIAAECRTQDTETLELLGQLNHQPTMQCLRAERAFLSRLGCDCSFPVGAYATFGSGGYFGAARSGAAARAEQAHGSVIGFLEGAPQVVQVEGNLWDSPVELGVELAELLLAERVLP